MLCVWLGVGAMGLGFTNPVETWECGKRICAWLTVGGVGGMVEGLVPGSGRMRLGAVISVCVL